MSKTITLKHPIKASGSEVSTVSLRKPKVRDIKNSRKGTDGEVEAEIKLISILSDSLTPDEVEELDWQDYKELQEVLEGFLS